MEEEEEVIVVEAVADSVEAEEEGEIAPIQASPEAIRNPETQEGRLWLTTSIQLDQQSKRAIIR